MPLSRQNNDFRPQCGTMASLIIFDHHIQLALRTQDQVLVIFFDLFAAFDRVSHQGIYVQTPHIAGVSIPYSQHHKLLGITFDSPRLTSRLHTELLRIRCQTRLNIMRVLSGTWFGDSCSRRLPYYQVHLRDLKKGVLSQLDVLHPDAVCLLIDTWHSLLWYHYTVKLASCFLASIVTSGVTFSSQLLFSSSLASFSCSPTSGSLLNLNSIIL